MMKSAPLRLQMLGLVLAVAVAGLAGCASPTSREVSSSQSSELEAASALEAFAGLSFDYDPFRTPADLSEEAEIVLTGRVAEFTDGRELVVTGTNRPSGSSVVLVVKSPRVILGERSDTAIYVELPNPEGKTPEEYNDLIPAETSVLVYLERAWDGTDPADESLKDAGAGRPDGSPLYRPVNPQSLILQAGDSLVWPLLGAEKSGSIEEAAPTGSLIAG